MKVLLATEWSPASIGGVQTHVRNLSLNLKKLGLTIIILTKHPCTNDQISFLEAKPIIPIRNILVPPNPESIKDALKSEKPDIIHVHHAFTLTSLITLGQAEKLGIRRVLTNHSISIGHDYELLWNIVAYTALLPYRFYISKAQTVISVSKAADRFIASFTSSKVPRIVVPNGVDVELFRPPKKENDDQIVLFVGRLVYRKGPHILLKAFNEALSEIQEAKLVIVGDGYMKPFLAL